MSEESSAAMHAQQIELQKARMKYATIGLVVVSALGVAVFLTLVMTEQSFRLILWGGIGSIIPVMVVCCAWGDVLVSVNNKIR